MLLHNKDSIERIIIKHHFNSKDNHTTLDNVITQVCQLKGLIVNTAVVWKKMTKTMSYLNFIYSVWVTPTHMAVIIEVIPLHTYMCPIIHEAVKMYDMCKAN